jgi:hypothetical protein
MPPKKNPMAGLTKAEHFLMLVAARLDSALRHLEANPGGDESIYLKGLSDEMVRRIIPFILWTFRLKMLQKTVDLVYSRFTQTQAAPHRVHPSIALVGEEWMRAAKLKRPANLRNLSMSALSKACANTAASFPKWPSALYSTDLSTYVAEQPIEQHWWLANKAAEGKYK